MSTGLAVLSEVSQVPQVLKNLLIGTCYDVNATYAEVGEFEGMVENLQFQVEPLYDEANAVHFNLYNTLLQSVAKLRRSRVRRIPNQLRAVQRHRVKVLLRTCKSVPIAMQNVDSQLPSVSRDLAAVIKKATPLSAKVRSTPLKVRLSAFTTFTLAGGVVAHLMFASGVLAKHFAPPADGTIPIRRILSSALLIGVTASTIATWVNSKLIADANQKLVAAQSQFEKCRSTLHKTRACVAAVKRDALAAHSSLSGVNLSNAVPDDIFEEDLQDSDKALMRIIKRMRSELA